MRTGRFALLRGVVAIWLALAAVAVSGCRSGDSEGEARRYQRARDAFVTSVRNAAAKLGNSVAGTYLDRTALNEPSPESDVLQQFQPQYQEFNRAYCSDLKAIAEAAAGGGQKLASSRIDEIRTTARDVVFDAMATALLHGALAAPPERRDQLLARLAVQATQVRDGTKLSGIAALQDAGLLGPDGGFTFPQRDTKEYEEYRTWLSHEAEGFAGRVGLLIEPTRGKVVECLPPR